MSKYLKYKNIKLRKKLSTEYKNFFYERYLAYNQNITFYLKFQIMLKNQYKKKILSKNKLTQRCILSNYPRSVMRLTSLAKSQFKWEFSKGNLTGFTKSS